MNHTGMARTLVDNAQKIAGAGLLVLTILLFTAACIPIESAEAGARATLDQAAAYKQSTAQARVDQQVAQQISAARTRVASDAEIAAIQAQAQGTQQAFAQAQAQAQATMDAMGYQRTQAALDRLGTVESSGLMLSATQTYAAATVAAREVDRQQSIATARGYAIVAVWIGLGFFVVYMAWVLPPAMRRYVDRKGSLHETRYFPVAWVAGPDGRATPQVLAIPTTTSPPPIINDWRTNIPEAPPAPVLHGDVLDKPRDQALVRAIQLVSDSIGVHGTNGVDVLGHRDAGMSSEQWQLITNLMVKSGMIVKTQAGTRTKDDLTLDDLLYTLQKYPDELYATAPP